MVAKRMIESRIKQGRGSAGAYATTNKSNRCRFFFSFYYYCYSSFLLFTLWSSDSKFNCNGGGASIGATVMVGATDHTVGGSTNRWDLGVDYVTWASTNTFYVGDNLVFTWMGNHDVVTTTDSEYDACTSSSSPYTSSPVTIPLTTPGITYYICSISDHCTSGMKVSVTTLSSSNSSSSTTTPNTPPSSSINSSPSPSSTFPLFFPSCFVTLVLSISTMLVLL